MGTAKSTRKIFAIKINFENEAMLSNPYRIALHFWTRTGDNAREGDSLVQRSSTGLR